MIPRQYNPEELKVAFHEKCLAVVNRSIGKTAIKPGIIVEATIDDGCAWAAFYRSIYQGSESEPATITSNDIWLDRDYGWVRFINVEELNDTDHVSVLARPDVNESRLLLDLAEIGIEQPRGLTTLSEHLELMRAAEEHDLLAVTPKEVIQAMHTMDLMIAVHDAAR